MLLKSTYKPRQKISSVIALKSINKTPLGGSKHKKSFNLNFFDKILQKLDQFAETV